MANKSLFASLMSYLPSATTTNDAGGAAYGLEEKHALAQLAATGCFNGTFYSDAEQQLALLKGLILRVNDNAFLAKLAIYSRERAMLKDMPAALTAVLAARDTALFHKVFDRVIDNGRVLRTLLQMIRSGQFGKKSLSSSVQRAFQRWLNAASPEKLLSASIGKDPSLRDILRLARPTPPDNARRATYGWLTDKEVAKWTPATEADLPEQIRLLGDFRKAETAEAQIALLERLTARWDLLADSAKSPAVWAAIARTMGPQALRMNLNTLQRHGVFGEEPGVLGRLLASALPSNLAKSESMVDYVAARLSDESEIRRARQFPYQYFAAYLNASEEIPHAIKAALHRAAELACGNVPKLPGPVVIGLDTSGSMQSPATGDRGRGATSKMRCVDVAALVAAAILRTNPDSLVVPFDTAAYDANVDPSDSILSLAERLAKFGGGGTDCSLPLRKANTDWKHRRFAGVVLVSDNESWVYRGRSFYTAGNATGVMSEWQDFVANQQKLSGGQATPKLVCIDLVPNTTTQAPERKDILNVGGFSDAVFDVIAAFLESDVNRFVSEIEAITL